jgi:GntR family transcriptional regulator
MPDVLAGFVPDRTSPVPLYFQLAQFLEESIASGRIPHGALFENEVQLAEQLGLSRPTMRSAMQHLVDKGLIVRRRGIGTRVVQPKVRRPLELSSLYDDLRRAGQRPTTTVLDVGLAEVDDEVAERLGCKPGTPVQHIVRLRSAAGTPIAKLTNFLPERVGVFEAEDLKEQGLYQLMRARGIVLHSATQSVGARTATAAETRILHEPRNAALLTMQRVTYDDHGEIVEYGSHIYSASRYSFETHLLAT